MRQANRIKLFFILIYRGNNRAGFGNIFREVCDDNDFTARVRAQTALAMNNGANKLGGLAGIFIF